MSMKDFRPSLIPVPEKRLLGLLIIPLACMIIGFFKPLFLLIGGLLDCTILFYAMFDVLTTISTKNFSLEVHPPRIFSIGRKNSISVSVVNRSDIPLELEIKIGIPQFWEQVDQDRDIHLDTDSLKTSAGDGGNADMPRENSGNDRGKSGPVPVKPGEKQVINLLYRPTRRGVYRITSLYVRYKTRGKVFSVHERMPLDLTVEVFPDVKELNYFVHLIRKNKLNDLGIHRNRFQGSGTELEYLREYHKDDDSRRIEWKVTTRINKPVSKVFRMESSNVITLVLDCGRLMTAEQDGLSALDYSINALLILAHIIVHMGDMLHIVAFSDKIIGDLPPGKGRNVIKRVSRFVTTLQPEFVESNYRLVISYLRTRLKKRSLIIFFSDLIDDIHYSVFSSSLHFLNKRHITLFILLRDIILMNNAEKIPESIRDLFVSASAQEMFLRRREAITKLRHSGLSVLDVLPAQVTPRLVDKYLELKGRNFI